ncbi:oxygen-independent coproporphyrinogen III oxidase [Salinicoccus sp. ID82-1]|uniref:radical SAM family heme chaperone HemW n=1 Tax=Salinicoccus sp. ID82-1 TaxID=2820269 RepID=UPI001F00C438|nr:radical SAM family heme chaperone HemW [Salinicoccus sp. ID82-1]MCG1008906.1 oxygen-independent coproporphyrinogen III oxidase [Salinicoccus sp. ID82-1]
MAESLYIHIPFCNRICTYCDFNKVLIHNQPVDAYLDALIRELRAIKAQNFRTIFVGGGTPTALSEAQLARLLAAVNERFHVTEEFTFEANPDELTPGKLDVLKNHGVNRISLGVQTFNEDLLKVLGRSHGYDDIFNAINHMEKIGLDNYSLDLMYNLPGETMQDLDDSLSHIQTLSPKHISWYSLIIEPHTVFYNQIRKGRMKVDDDDIEGQKYQHVINGLRALGYPQYEISNFSQPAYESEHNKTYWKNEPYYGAGAGSHGYIDSTRYYNIKPVNHYIQSMDETGSVVKETLPLDIKAQMEEEMFLGLRMNRGVDANRFESKFGRSMDDVYGTVIRQETDRGHITSSEGYVALTDAGRMVGNTVFMEFLLEE